MKNHTKLKRLFAAVAQKGGALTSQKALAEAMQVSEPLISQWFGHGTDNVSVTLPPPRLAKFVAVFRAAGIDKIDMHWLSASLDKFDRLLGDNIGIDVRPPLSWPDALRLHARNYEGLRLQRPAVNGGFRLRIEGEPARTPIDRFRIDERVYLALDLPDTFLHEGDRVFATSVHEVPSETTCLFPLEGASGIPLNGPTMRFPDGQLPDGRPRNFQVSGPAGVQQVHAVLSRFRPAAAVHAKLEDIDLQMGLDRLASELSGRPADSWSLLSLTYQVEPAAPEDGHLAGAALRK
jgi:hypothetical protein